MRKINWKRIATGLLVVIVLGIGGFVVWADTPSAPMAEAVQALQSDAKVTVTTQNGWYVFTPASQPPTTGFIFYPGGRVDARAYAPEMHAIAANGYLTVITPMPLNLAIFGINQANDVIKAFSGISHWAIGGHSLGGSMTARYVQGNPAAVEGLVFWASYPDIDLSTFKIEVVSVSGTLDGLSTPDKIKNSIALLPTDTMFVPIAGGNHGQFGWYGDQAGDNPATISRDEQQAQTVTATSNLLARLDSSGG